MPARRPGPTGSVGVVLLAAAVALSAGASCAGTPLPPSGGRWEHPKHGYAIDAPQIAPEVWEAVSIDGADLGYRRPDGSALTLMSDCGRGSAPPSLLARQLLIGTAERELLTSEPIELAGDPGWRLAFRTREQGREVTVRSVTLTSGGCTFDWVWVAPGRTDEAPWFEDWWASFTRGEASS